MNTLETLLMQSVEFAEADISDTLFGKVLGEIKAGSKVEIYWKGREQPDYGYFFSIPEQDVQDGDIFIHVPQMDNSDGIGNGHEIHIHLYKLLTNEMLESITVLKD